MSWGETSFYALSDVDRSLLGVLRAPGRAPIVTEETAHCTVSLYVVLPHLGRPVMVGNGVPAGDPDQLGRWHADGHDTPRADARVHAFGRLTARRRVGAAETFPIRGRRRWRSSVRASAR